MNLLSGLEKFGISADGDLDITKEDKGQNARSGNRAGAAQKQLSEADFLLDKVVTCPVCDQKFHTLVVKTGKAKHLESDPDLRPHFEGVDTLKYDAVACPFCGYSAMQRDFVHLSTTQIKWIKAGVSSKFKPVAQKPKKSYTYDEAVDRLKLALVSTMVKKGKMSEKAYICLKIAWLRRTQYESAPNSTPEEKKKREQIRQEWDGFYRQAYDGFTKAVETEMPPYCGMDSNTVDFMIANMAMYFKDYAVAAKLVSRLLTSPNSGQRVKDKCLDLKDQIIAEQKK